MSRIDTQTDLKILADLALGYKNKDLAVKYNVSPSYVSKLKTGRKQLNVRIINSIQPVAVSREEVMRYVKQRIAELTHELNVLYTIQKGE